MTKVSDHCYDLEVKGHGQIYQLKVSKGAKIRNRYNQVPHLTQDTDGKVTNSQQTPQTRAMRSALSQQVTTKHIYTDAHKDIANTRQNKNIKVPQKKSRLGTVSKILNWIFFFQLNSKSLYSLKVIKTIRGTTKTKKQKAIGMRYT